MGLLQKIADSHYIGERIKAFTNWEGDKRWQEVVIVDKHPTFATVTNGNYQFCLHWQSFNDTELVMPIGG